MDNHCLSLPASESFLSLLWSSFRAQNFTMDFSRVSRGLAVTIPARPCSDTGHIHSVLWNSFFTPVSHPISHCFSSSLLAVSFFLVVLIGGELLYNVVLVSAYNNVNQLHVYKYPLPLEPSSHPTPPSHPSRSSHNRELSSLRSITFFY